VLLRKQRGGNQDGNLLAILHCLESGAHGDFGFAVAHIAHDDAVHGYLGFHVLFNRVDSHHLVFCFDVGEVIFHLHLPRGIRRELVPGRCLALGVELHQLAGDFAHRSAGLLLGVFPVGATHFGQVRGFTAGVFGQHVQRVHGHPELIGGLPTLRGSVFEHDIFAAR